MRIATPASIVCVMVVISIAAVQADETASGGLPERQTVAQLAKPIDWNSVAAKVGDELRKRDLLKWSDELAGKLAGADTEMLQVAVEVFRRAGQPERTFQAILGLGKSSLAGRRGDDWGIVRRLFELGWYEQARAWFDTFPAQCPPDDERAFVKWLVEKEGATGAETWLHDKAGKEGVQGGFRHGNWERLYWGLLANNGKLESYVKDLAEKIKQAPTDADLVFEYVSARENLPNEQRPQATWLAETCRLERASHNFALGRMFSWDDPPEASILFFDRSLACPVTDYDRRHFNEFSTSSAYIGPDSVEEILRRWTKADLAMACFKAKKLDRAQKLVEELTGKKDGTLEDLGPFQLAGQAQAASGQRIVEGRIKKAEEENKDSIRYWLNRASYYRGRKELENADEAYRAALKLPAYPLKSEHFEAVRDYGWFLVQQYRLEDANRVFRDEIKRIGPKGLGVDFWLNQLQSQVNDKGGPLLKWDEPIIWDYLTGQKDSFGQDAQWRFQWAAAEAKRAGDFGEFEKKARVLMAEPGSPSLQFIFGEIVRRFGDAKEGTQLMAEAYVRSPRTQFPGDATATERLLEAYFTQRDLVSAEKMIDQLLSEPNCSLNLGKFALMAAHNWAPQLAMRLWRVKTGFDLTDLEGLDKLADKGLTYLLNDFYSGLAKQAPNNPSIAAALKILARK